MEYKYCHFHKREGERSGGCSTGLIHILPASAKRGLHVCYGPSLQELMVGTTMNNVAKVRRVPFIWNTIKYRLLSLASCVKKVIQHWSFVNMTICDKSLNVTILIETLK